MPKYLEPHDAITEASRLTNLLIQSQNFLQKADGNYIHFMQDPSGEAGKNVAINLTAFHRQMTEYLQGLEY